MSEATTNRSPKGSTQTQAPPEAAPADQASPAANGTRTTMLGSHFAWDGGGRLVVHDETFAEEVLRVPHLSPSTMQALESCPARWAAERALPRTEDPFAANELGTTMHAVFEELFQLPHEQRTVAEAMRLLAGMAEEVVDVDGHPLSEKEKARWVSAAWAKGSGLWTFEDPTAVDVHTVEERFEGISIPTKSGMLVPVKGFIDRVDEIPVGAGKGLKVKDYKTGKAYEDKHPDQLRFYIHAYQAKTGEIPAEASLLYTQDKIAREDEVDVSPRAMAGTLAKIEKGWKTLNEAADKRLYATKPTALCAWCVLVQSCAKGKARVKSQNGLKQMSTQPSAEWLGIPSLEQVHERAAALAVAAAEEVIASAIDTVGADVPPRAERQEPHTPTQDAPARARTETNTDASNHKEPTMPRSSTATIVPEEAYVDAIGDDLPDPFPPFESYADYEGGAPAAAAEPQVPAVVPAAAPVAKVEPLLGTGDKPWVETINGGLNPESYATMAVFANVSLAYETLCKGGHKVSVARLRALSSVFTAMVGEVEAYVVPETSLASNINTRIRGALRSYLEINPVPIDQPKDAFGKWVTTGVKHMRLMAESAVWLYADGVTDLDVLYAAETPNEDFDG